MGSSAAGKPSEAIRSPAPQGVDHPGEARKAAEENEPLPGLVADFFVVDESAPEIQHALQHRHVVGLALDNV